MILLGALLLVCGFVLAIHFLVVLGVILLVVGLVLALAGAAGRPVGGRRFWY